MLPRVVHEEVVLPVTESAEASAVAINGVSPQAPTAAGSQTNRTLNPRHMVGLQVGVGRARFYRRACVRSPQRDRIRSISATIPSRAVGHRAGPSAEFGR